MTRGTTIAGSRGGLGWVILIAALAVPGVLFYNWWSHLKTEREKTVAAKARGRVPDGGVFPASPNSAKLVNPMTPAVPEPRAAIAAAASAPAPEASSQELPAQWSVSEAAVSTMTAPSLKRDPMLSPFDLLSLKQEEEDKRLALERLEAERDLASRRASRRAPSPEALIELQGIISAPEGESKAIINNEVVGVGGSVGKFRVLRITAAGVTFEYQGRRFTKSVNRE